MSLVLGVDLGTTTITALALDTDTGTLRARATCTNNADITAAADRVRGYSEWDAPQMITLAGRALRSVADQLGTEANRVAGLGITGQQHGMVIVDAALKPLTPFVNWQDRRAEQVGRRSGLTLTQEARRRVGPQAPHRAGCQLASGFLAVTLFALKESGRLPAQGTACFLMDYLSALLTGQSPITDPTCAASAGVFDLTLHDWDQEAIDRLELPVSFFPAVRPSGSLLGSLRAEWAAELGFPMGMPVFVGIGDNQASFLGSVAEPAQTVLVNIGTGGQVARVTTQPLYEPPLEARPFFGGSFLLVCAGLSGGRAYAALEGFFRQVARDLLAQPDPASLYDRLNTLAAQVPRGADGLRCEPFFSGTRYEPERRGVWTGMSATNFTPAHLTRALLEGMAHAFHNGYEAMQPHLPAPAQRLVGAGNGVRENPLMGVLLAEEFGLAVEIPVHREEAAYGAALLAAVSAGIFPDLTAAGRLIRYQSAAG